MSPLDTQQNQLMVLSRGRPPKYLRSFLIRAISRWNEIALADPTMKNYVEVFCARILTHGNRCNSPVDCLTLDIQLQLVSKARWQNFEEVTKSNIRRIG